MSSIRIYIFRITDTYIGWKMSDDRYEARCIPGAGARCRTGEKVSTSDTIPTHQLNVTPLSQCHRSEPEPGVSYQLRLQPMLTSNVSDTSASLMCLELMSNIITILVTVKIQLSSF